MTGCATIGTRKSIFSPGRPEKSPLRQRLQHHGPERRGMISGNSARSRSATSSTPRRIAKQYKALAVSTSPPRYWTLDWIADRIGAVRNFDGLDAVWMGTARRPRQTSPPSRAPTPIAPCPPQERRSRVSKRDRTVYLLDDPKGRTWVMVSYTNKVVPGHDDRQARLRSAISSSCRRAGNIAPKCSKRSWSWSRRAVPGRHPGRQRERL